METTCCSSRCATCCVPFGWRGLCLAVKLRESPRGCCCGWVGGNALMVMAWHQPQYLLVDGRSSTVAMVSLVAHTHCSVTSYRLEKSVVQWDFPSIRTRSLSHSHHGFQGWFAAAATEGMCPSGLPPAGPTAEHPHLCREPQRAGCDRGLAIRPIQHPSAAAQYVCASAGYTARNTGEIRVHSVALRCCVHATCGCSVLLYDMLLVVLHPCRSPG